MSTAAAVCAMCNPSDGGGSDDGDAHFRPRSGTATKTRRCRFCSSRNVVLLLQPRNTLLQCSACEQLPSSIRKNDDEKTKRGGGGKGGKKNAWPEPTGARISLKVHIIIIIILKRKK